MCLSKNTTFVQLMNLLQALYTGKLNPIQQILFIGIMQMLFVLTFLLLGINGRNVWMALQAPVLFYTCMTIMIGIFNQNGKWYYLFSIGGYALIFSLSILLSYIVSGEALSRQEGFINVLILNTVFYFMLLMISILYRGIKEFLEKME
jgi:hypothetical membrane protein